MYLWSKITGKFASLRLAPQTRLARFTLYLAVIELGLLLTGRLLKTVGAANATASLGGWLSFLTWILAVLVLVLALRWFRNHVMWSVRNRLIVTYLFIGGVPVTLAVVMAVVTGVFAMEHLATYLAVSEIHAQGQRLAEANAAAADEITKRNHSPQQIMAADAIFPGRSITMLRQASTPQWIKDGFTGLVCDQHRLHLRGQRPKR